MTRSMGDIILFQSESGTGWFHLLQRPTRPVWAARTFGGPPLRCLPGSNTPWPCGADSRCDANRQPWNDFLAVVSGFRFVQFLHAGV